MWLVTLHTIFLSKWAVAGQQWSGPDIVTIIPSLAPQGWQWIEFYLFCWRSTQDMLSGKHGSGRYIHPGKWLVWQLGRVATRDVGKWTWHFSLRETTDVFNSSPGLLRRNQCRVEPNLVQCVLTNRCGRRQTKTTCWMECFERANYYDNMPIPRKSICQWQTTRNNVWRALKNMLK